MAKKDGEEVGTEGGLKEAASIADFASLRIPRECDSESRRILVDALRDPISVGRLAFELGRMWELEKAARKAIEANPARAIAMTQDPTWGEFGGFVGDALPVEHNEVTRG